MVFSCLCGERQCVEEGFSDKGRLLMVGNSVALPSGREGGGHILIDNWLEFYEIPHSCVRHLWGLVHGLSGICWHQGPHVYPRDTEKYYLMILWFFALKYCIK